MTYWREVLHDDVMRAHEQWLFRGREGDGQLILRNARLGAARTYGKTFEYSIFEACDFAGAQITHSRFNHAQIVDCTFEGGSVYSGRMRWALLRRVRFDRADVRACWIADAIVEECSFDGSDLDRSNFVRTTIAASTFKNARLADTQLDHAKFRRCDFRGASMNDTAHGSEFIDCDFRGANIDRLKLNDTRFVRCKFAGVVGKPIIEGAFELTDSDFSTEDTASDGPQSDHQLRQQWEAPRES